MHKITQALGEETHDGFHHYRIAGKKESTPDMCKKKAKEFAPELVKFKTGIEMMV